jgi:ABC-type bacteriocin/lantibiotic exporter with double-glycine peptidase domain
MVALTVAGVLVGLVPPLALGALVDALIESDDVPEAIVLTGVIVVAICVAATAYIVSEGIYARNAGRLSLSLRTQMFEGAARRAQAGEDVTGLPSRFISDAETLEQVTLYLLDSGIMMLVSFGMALVAIEILQPWSILVVTPALIGIWVLTRRMQRPVATAGQRRQEELETMTDSVSRELARSRDPLAASRFRGAAEGLMVAEVRLGWLRAFNLQGSGGLASLGPIAVVVVAAFVGTQQIGTLISLYLLAQAVFSSFDGLVDLSLGIHGVRGAVVRCFEVIDTPGAAADATLTGSVA